MKKLKTSLRAKRSNLIFILLISSLHLTAQIKISDLPTYTDTAVTGWLPIVQGTVTKKISAAKLTSSSAAVISVFGRTGAVVALGSDYSFYYPVTQRFLDSIAALRALIGTGGFDTLSLSNRINAKQNFLPAGTNLQYYDGTKVLRTFSTSVFAVGDPRYAALIHSHTGLAPIGGNTGQVLKKISNNDFDFTWSNDNVGLTGSDTASLSNRINLKQNISDTNTVDATRYWVGQQGFKTTFGTLQQVTDNGATTTNPINVNAAITANLLGYNSAIAQLATASSVASYANESTGFVDFIGFTNGIRFIKPNALAYGDVLLEINNSGSIKFPKYNTSGYLFNDVAGTITTSTSISDTYISSATTWTAKQPQLNGTGFVKANGTTISYDNSTYLTSATGVSSFNSRTGAVVAAANDYTFAQIASKPTTIAGYGITDFNSLGDVRYFQLTGGTLTGNLSGTTGFFTSAFSAQTLRVQQSSSDLWDLNSNGNVLTFSGYNGTSFLSSMSLSRAGAATFLNSVTATSFIGAGTGLTGTASGLSIGGNAATVTTNANLTGDVTSVGNATTLATVNSNVGTWNNVTVNGKGLITAGSNVAYLTSSQTYYIGTTLNALNRASATQTLTGVSIDGNSATTTLYNSYVGFGSASSLLTGSSNLQFYDDETGRLIVQNVVQTVNLELAEVSAVGGNPSAGYGRFWTKTDGTPHYVNSAGIDIQLGAAGSGVSSILGTANQVIASGATAVTLSLPQSIATTSNVIFGSVAANTAKMGAYSGVSTYAWFGHRDFNTSTGHALLQTDGGLTIVNSVGTLYLRTNATDRLTLSSTAATFSVPVSGTSATFSSSVTATSFVKTNGTSSQILMADGSVKTIIEASASLPFTTFNSGNQVQCFTVSGAAVGDVVQLGIPGSIMPGVYVFQAYVNAANQVCVVANHVTSGSSQGLSTATFKIAIIK